MTRFFRKYGMFIWYVSCSLLWGLLTFVCFIYLDWANSNLISSIPMAYGIGGVAGFYVPCGILFICSACRVIDILLPWLFSFFKRRKSPAPAPGGDE